jgi:hypothetical protein
MRVPDHPPGLVAAIDPAQEVGKLVEHFTAAARHLASQ